jgi:hypothetical protein
MAHRKLSQPDPASPLADLMEPTHYVDARSWVFRGVESWKWFVRRHRLELGARGAVLELGGRLLVHAAKFDAAVLELAQPARRYPREAAADARQVKS